MQAKRLDLGVALGCLAGAGALCFLFATVMRHDDAFITFRYARNLAEGAGLAFNPGERQLGTTSPLFTLLCTAFYSLFGDALPTVAVAWNAFALAAQGWFLYLLVRRELPVTGVAVAAFVLAGASTPYSYLALETHTATALVLAALWASTRDRPGLAGTLAGLAVLARHDAVLLGPLLLLRYRGREEQRSGLRFLAAAATVTLPWFLFATAYFGWPMPRTLEAKQGITPFGDYLAHYAELFFTVPGLPAVGWTRAAAVLLAAAGLFVVLRRLRALLPFFGFTLALVVVYASIGPPAEQHWHLYPATLAVRLLVVLGALGLVEHRLRTDRPAAGWWRTAVPAALAVAWFVPLAIGCVETSRQVPDAHWLGVRHSRYEQVAAWALDHAGPGRSMLAIEVGTLGYLTDYRMVDPYGLVTPTVGDPEDPEHILGLLHDERPDLVLMPSPWHARYLEDRTPYRTVHVFPWVVPWSTLLVREPGVLLRPQEMPALRREVRDVPLPEHLGDPWPNEAPAGEAGR